MNRFVLSSVAVLAFASVTFGQVKPDSRFVNYRKSDTAVSGKIKVVGSDTLLNTYNYFKEGFNRSYPNVEIEVEGKGSSTAPPALTNGTSTFGPMSRRMKDSEQDGFEKQYGYKPTYFRVGIDMLAVFVHRDNPIAKKGLTLPQIDAIFSKTRQLGYPRDVKTWGDLGLTGEWADKPISLYGRNSVSGTYGFFNKVALGKGDYKNEVKEQPGSAGVIQGCANDKYAIGYSGIGYKTAGVAAVAIAADSDSDFVVPASENVSDYPLTRYLYTYINKKPGVSLDPLRTEFLKYVYSIEGQNDVIKSGYLPAPYPVAKADLTKLSTKIIK